MLAAAEAQLLSARLPTLFGYHALVLGTPTRPNWLDQCRVGHRCCVETFPFGSGRRNGHFRTAVMADLAQLPMASKSVDVVILPHSLEFVDDPRPVLREVERVLVADGHVLIAGFNPWSLWGLWWLVRRRAGHSPWDGRLLSVRRLRDWLALLGCETVSVSYAVYRPPLRRRGLLRRLGFLETLGRRWWPAWGGTYVLLARKRTIPLTPVRPRWRPRRLWVPGGAVAALSRHDKP